MSASLQLPGGLITLNPQPEIARYYNVAGLVYASTAQVLSEIVPAARYVGQTFLIGNTEYWFSPTTANASLVIKGDNTNVIHKTGFATETKVGELVIDSGVNNVSGLVLSKIPNSSSSTTVPYSTGLEYPFGIAILPNGDALVTSQITNDIKRIPVGGGAPVSYATTSAGTMGIALFPNGDALVTHGGTGTVSKIPAGGGVAVAYSTGFNNAIGIAILPNGEALVTNAGNNTVSKIPVGGGAPVPYATGFNYPFNILILSDGSALVTNATTNVISKIPIGGGAATVYGTVSTNSAGLVILPSGELIVSCNLDIQKIPAGGGAATLYSSVIANSYGIALAPSGDILIANGSNNIVTRLPAPLNKVLKTDFTGKVIKTQFLEDIQYQTPITNPITGLGTSNRLPKFGTSSTLVDSSISDTGSAVTIVNPTTLLGDLTLSAVPVTSAGTYDILTRNTGTGVIEKVAGVGLFELIANKQNTMTVDGFGIKYPTVDAVNFQTNYIARAVVATGFLDTTDPFSISRFDDFTLAISATQFGVAFSQRFKTSPFAPSEGIINIAAQTVPLSVIPLPGDGTFIRFVGIQIDGTIVWSPTQFIQSPSVCQLGIVLVKRIGGVTSFIDATRTAITIPDVSAYSNLDTTSTGVKATTSIAAIPGTLSHTNTQGSFVGISVAWGTSNNDSKVIPLHDPAPTPFTRLHPGNALPVAPPPPTFTTLDPTQAYIGGVLGPVAGNPNQATVQRLLFNVNGNFVWQYAEKVYTNLIAAQNNVLQAPFTNILPEGTFAEIGRMAITINCTDLNSSSAQYYPTGAGGGGGTAPVAPAAWGGISGIIDDQLDLTTKFNTKLNLAGGVLTGGLTLPLLIINATPTTSASTYDILTRNTTTGVVEKVLSTAFQPALTNPVTGTGLNGQVSFFTGANTQAGDAGFKFSSADGLALGTATPLTGGGGAKWFTANGTTTYGGGLISSISGVAKAYFYSSSGFAIVRGASGEGVQLVTDASTTTLTALVNGNVGIGTTAPIRPLDVNGIGRIRSSFYVGIDDVANNRFIEMTPSTTTAKVQIQAILAGTGPDDLLLNSVGGNVGIGSTNAPAQKLDVNGGIISSVGGSYGVMYFGTTAVSIYGDASNTLTFGTNSTEKMRITSAGNVGIGTNAPTQGKVTIAGASNLLAMRGLAANDAEYLSWYNSAGTRRGYFGFGGVGSSNISLSNDESGGHIILATTGGYVGIDVIPTEKLTVSGNILASTGYGGGFRLEDGFGILRQAGYTQFVYGSATDVMHLNASGISVNGTITVQNGILIGTGNAIGNGYGLKMDYKANDRTSLTSLNAGSGYGLFYYQGTSGRDGADSMEFVFGTTDPTLSTMSVKTNGDIKVKGNITATAFFAVSDIKLKNIIRRDGDVAYFKWKDGRDDKEHIGYIAQEKQVTNPDQTQKGEDDMLTVNYIELLVEKIRGLEKRIQELENK